MISSRPCLVEPRLSWIGYTHQIYCHHHHNQDREPIRYALEERKIVGTPVLESRGRYDQEPRQMEEKPDWIDMSSLPQVQTRLFYPNGPIEHLHLQG